MKSSEIRKAFIKYFAKQNHQVVASSSLVPAGDKTLLFTNAGMVQFKDTFLGIEPRPYQRAVSSQRCLRAGGKHNDLDNVGYTARHHTFFEMLGNFSFGDYFKREAIRYAWEFLTVILGLPPERLWITVYQDDDEAADIWLKEIGVSPERFSRCGEKDNFWSMGDTGPCGPCSEIFYDHGPEIPGGPPGSADADLDRYIEIWNLVFMQFNRDKDGTLHPLPKPSVDTGMGLERITAVIQGVHNNYQIDSFQTIIEAIAELGQLKDKTHPSLKVIADHIRACSFLIADGVIPNNEGRGYVLRRIIRRAIRHGNKLGLKTPFFNQLVTPLAKVMGEAYPELSTAKAHIERVLEQEENQFARTLEQGLRLLQEEIKGLNGTTLSGEAAFKLYDTYGFPVDLTADIVREQNLNVDLDAFQVCMQRQRDQSLSASQFQVDYSDADVIEGESRFHGYEKEVMASEVIALQLEGKSVDKLVEGNRGSIVLKDTPFYAESGGQVGDKGFIRDGDNLFRVDDTKKQGNAIVHYGSLIQGQFVKGQRVQSEIDKVRRQAIRLNHTATHLLHAALKQMVGSHVEQRGSLVDADRARFDFSSQEAISPKILQQIENLVNEKIRDNYPVTTTLMNIEEAKKSGAVALFGEKYQDEVRVLSLGDFSKELCGGTHASRTGDIGLFKITAEYGVASGVRRIEMVTGAFALDWVNEQSMLLTKAALELKTTPNSLLERLSQWMQEHKEQEKQLQQLQQKLLLQSAEGLTSDVQKIGDIELLIKRMDDLDAQGLRSMLDQLKSRLNHAVIVLFSISSHKMNIVIGVSKALIGRVPAAGALVKHLCGKGGGRDDMAQGGGPVPDDLEEKILQMKAMIEASLTKK